MVLSRPHVHCLGETNRQPDGKLGIRLGFGQFEVYVLYLLHAYRSEKLSRTYISIGYKVIFCRSETMSATLRDEEPFPDPVDEGTVGKP